MTDEESYDFAAFTNWCKAKCLIPTRLGLRDLGKCRSSGLVPEGTATLWAERVGVDIEEIWAPGPHPAVDLMDALERSLEPFKRPAPLALDKSLSTAAVPEPATQALDKSLSPEMAEEVAKLQEMAEKGDCPGCGRPHNDPTAPGEPCEYCGDKLQEMPPELPPLEALEARRKIPHPPRIRPLPTDSAYCPVCGKPKSKRGMRYHIRLNHPNVDPDVSWPHTGKLKPKPVPPEDMVSCKICGEKFSKVGLPVHQGIKHTIEEIRLACMAGGPTPFLAPALPPASDDRPLTQALRVLRTERDACSNRITRIEAAIRSLQEIMDIDGG